MDSPVEGPPLTDAAGNVAADVLLVTAAGVRWAILTSHAAPEVVAPAALTQLGGHRVVTDSETLAELLVAAGGVVQRRAHDYRYDLADAPPEWAEWPAPPGFRLTRDLDPARLAAAHASAYAAGHADHRTGLDHAEDLRAMVAGEVVGPNVPRATWQADDADGPCAAVIVSERPTKDGGGVAWVLDVFVDPRHHGRGVGGALLRRAVAGAAAAGYGAIGLVVSDGNPARRAYGALGFHHVASGTNVDLP